MKVSKYAVFIASQVLLNLTRPFKKVTMAYLATELSLSIDEVESLLVDMILDERLSAQIDQIHGYVIVTDTRVCVANKKSQGLGKWADKLTAISDSFATKFT